MQHQQSLPGKEPDDLKQTYETILGLIDNAKDHLANLRFETDPKRPDILPGIPQAILPVLRRIVQQSQAFKTILRVSVKGKPKGGKEDEAGKKRRRENATDSGNAVAGSAERQIMRDKLDEEGTNLWNRTLLMSRLIKMTKEAPSDEKDRSRMQLRQEAFGNWEKLFAYCRYAGYALIQVSGDDRTRDARLVMRNLELATKTSLALYAANDHEEARKIMGIAAELGNSLSDMMLEGSSGVSDNALTLQECRRNIIDYYLARCTLEIDRDNETLAGTLMSTALSHCSTADVAARSIQAVVRRCLEIGRNLLSRIQDQKGVTEKDSDNALAAVRWLSKGVQLVESKEGAAAVAKFISHFKTPLLESLARASILSADRDNQALDRAQTITDDLLRDADISRDRDKVQSFLLINLKILRHRKASSQNISKLLEKIIDMVDWQDEENVMRSLAEVDQPPMKPKEAIAIYGYFLRSALKDAEDNRKTYAARILLALIILLQKQEEPFSSAQELHNALDALAAVDDFRLEPSQAIAIATMIWKAADKISQNAAAKSFAAEWFLAGAHPVFSKSVGSRSSDKWRRRAVICYLAINEHAKAEEQLWLCDPADADTLYLQFALSIATGQVDQACGFATKLGKASNCSDGHLTLAMQSAAGSGEESVTKTVMRVMLACKSKEVHRNSENIGLIRALIRMYLKDIDTKTALTREVIAEVLALYEQALEICAKLESQGDLALHAKDTAWCYKSLFNLSLDGMTSWTDTDHIVKGFSVAVELMKVYKSIPGASTDPALMTQMVRAIHASLCGTVFAAREAEDDHRKKSLWSKAEKLLQDLQVAFSEDPDAKTKTMRDIQLHAYILEVEILGRLGRFDEIQKALEAGYAGFFVRTGLMYPPQSIQPETIPIQVCEAVADLSFQPGLPPKVTHALQNLALKIAIKANDAFGILRWSRSIIELLIHRNDGDDLEDALAHVQKARTVAEEFKAEVRDSDELEWLLATSWNQGLDFLNLSNATAQARLWMETALGFCSFVKNGEERMNHMRKIYNNALQRQ